jgi:hypothetical protein
MVENRLKIGELADRMPALKPQSSVIYASYVAFRGQYLCDLGRKTNRVKRPTSGLAKNRISTFAKLNRHSVLGDREPKAHLLTSQRLGFSRCQANVTWRESDTE